jgi:protein SCO1
MSWSHLGRPRPLLCALAIVMTLSHVFGCSRSADQGRIGQNSSAALRPVNGFKETPVLEVKEYTLIGEVKKVDQEAHEITIRHEAISGLMGAMTMPFRLKNGAMLDDVRPGDQVEGKLRVERENGVIKDYQLLDLTVTKPALAGSLVVDLSAGTPKLRAQPRRLEVGDEVADFTMISQDGKTVKLSDLRGYVVVLTFIYTRCPLPDFCPLMDRKFADLAQSISAFPERAAKIRLISLSFDPEHDTPEILHKHAQIRGGTPPLWSFAVANHDELARIAPALGFVYGPGKDEIIHNLCTAIIDPEGKLARLEVGTQSNKWSSSDLLRTIYSLLPPLRK